LKNTTKAPQEAKKEDVDTSDLLDEEGYVRGTT
jgi:hypothetical protein